MRQPIADVWFADRWRRAVYEEPDGRQSVYDVEGGDPLDVVCGMNGGQAW